MRCKSVAVFGKALCGRSMEQEVDGMSDVKDLIKIILIAPACPLVLPVVINEKGDET